MKSILLINGPNLSLLGIREPELYGTQTLEELNRLCSNQAAALGCKITQIQTNHEGEIIDAILDAPGKHTALLINPGAFSHTSLAIADAIRAVGLPALEVHISNIFDREPIRRSLPISEACNGLIAGLGFSGYCLALRWLAQA